MEACVVVCQPLRPPRPCHLNNTQKFQRLAGESACALHVSFSNRGWGEQCPRREHWSPGHRVAAALASGEQLTWSPGGGSDPQGGL